MKKHFTNILTALLAFIFLSACSAGSSSKKDKVTLRDALQSKFFIGTAMNEAQITGRDTAGIRLIEQNFNAIVPENCMKSQEIHPEENRYNFRLPDAFVDFGTSRGLHTTGHALIWHSQLSPWFCVGEKGEPVSPEILKARMKEHIYTLVERYKGRIAGWDVVNEAINDDGSWRESPFYRILGEEFFYLAFQYAHEADPEAELYYNDYNEWHPGKREAIVRIIKTMKEKGLRIDAVGMQGHVGMDYPSIDEYRDAIKAYSAAGVKVMITELDISALPNPRWNVGANVSDTEAYRQEMNPYTDGLPASVEQTWNARVMDFFNLFLEESEHISRVTFWGVADGDSWKNDFPMRGRTDYPLLFDRNHQAKPVVGTIIEAASNK